MLVHPWDFQGKSTGVECHSLLQGQTLEGRKLWSFDLKTKLTNAGQTLPWDELAGGP